MVITAIVIIDSDKHEFQFEMSSGVMSEEILDKAFEIAMYKYYDFDEVYIDSIEED